TIRFFIPPEYRKRTHGFYQMEERDATGVPTVLVPRLTEDMATCSLESLHPAILAYYDRAFAKHFSNKYGASKQLLGHCVSGWREDGFHVPATQRVRETFNALNIPWKQEWSDMATLRAAKLRLAA
ncbi:hypothetical protein EBZ80_19115, partial [bacterium]|nr:hypothetical protein [bacterium]